MGNYNPHAPYIIGQEWVPIRQANFEPDDGITERGYQFYLDHAAPVVSGAYYVASPPPMTTFNVAEFISVYPAGTENETGPIKSLTIPVSAVGITGTGISGTVDALLNPSDGNVVGFSAGPGNTGTLGLSFDVTNYSQQLFGKRILDLQFAYTASGSVAGLATFQTWIRRLLGGNSLGYQTGLEGAGATSGSAENDIHYVPFTDLNPYWAAGGGSIDGSLQPFVYPWRYPELANFAVSAIASNRLIVYITTSLSSLIAFTDDCSMGYAALKVTYCEEKRVLYGGDRINFSTGGNFYPPTPTGKLIMLRTTDLAIPTTLAAGKYTVVENHRKIASTFVATSPNLFALRELYQLPHQQGIHVNRSLVVDETFTVDESSVLPHITLHTASAVVTGVHAYGTQNDVPVYGSITAIQEIEDDPVGAATAFPQVRFYARRFGNTTAPLRLINRTVDAGLDLPGTAGNYASTPDNAALDIVGDIDIRVDATLDDWTPSVDQTLIAKYTDAGNQRSYRLYIDTNGRPVLSWSTDGTGPDVIAVTSTTAVTAQNGERLAVRATLDVNDGAGGRVITFYTAPTIDGPWTQIFQTTQVGVTSIFSGTAVLEVGSIGVGTAFLAAGVVHAAKVLTGINGTEVANPNFGAQPPGTLVFVDAAGRTWTVIGTAAIISGLGASTVSITPAEFDALTEIVDGWREVTLRFATVPTFATAAGDTNWQWDAVGETAGNQWQVLGADGPSTTIHSIAPATYYAPQGDTVTLTWQSPTISGTAVDTLSDAVLIFSQDPPAITGFAVGTASQAITGIGQNCGINPRCIPTAISYINLTWSAQTFLPVTGFGQYELERFDAIDGEWKMIMNATSPAVTGFADYEARVGVLSQYRIRTCNVLDFCGPWVTGSATIPTPGVVVNGAGNSTLIFTSNRQPTSNLAYTMTWEGVPIETFVFPEADEVQLQRMFGKDFFTAFHPLERGGEQFTRSLIVNAAATALPSLANFRGLRDLAWASLNYVCVRDELGNRWYANVRVPDGAVRMDRTIYVAQIQVSEVTDTPDPIDPGGTS